MIGPELSDLRKRLRKGETIHPDGSEWVLSFADEARRGEARRTRIERSDRAVAAELSATFVGTLVELAELGRPVVIVTGAGSHHRGRIAGVGADVIVVQRETDGRRVLLAPAAIDAIRESSPGHRRPVDDAPRSPRLADVLDELSTDGARLAVVTAGGNRFMGRAQHVGVDQLVIGLDGDGDSLTLPLAAIFEVAVEP